MKVRVYRNLDRPMTILGIKGKFIGVAGGMIILDLIVGLVVGKLTHAFVAMGLIVILLINKPTTSGFSIKERSVSDIVYIG